METAEFYIDELKKAKEYSFELSNKWGKIIQQFEKEALDIHIKYHMELDINEPNLNSVYLLWDHDVVDNRWRLMVEGTQETQGKEELFIKPFMQLPHRVKLAIIPFLDKFLKSFINHINHT